jgi:dTDP-4-amino-4,6-dideoxygalactose transaminase
MFIDRKDIEPFEEKIWLSTPTMHGEDELQYIREAFEKNWITTSGDNVIEVERLISEYLGCKYAIGLSAGTAALHLCMKLAGQRIHPNTKATDGFLKGMKVFCTDTTFDATVNPIVYEGGEPIFIDSEYETWNMDPKALERAFFMYPEVKLVVVANLYGTPAKLDEIQKICKIHGALLIEDAAESLGATFNGKQTGTFGDYNAISYNGNKIITGSCGGALLTDNKEDADKARKWSTQAREIADWYQHEELGYNYRISNIVAGIIRGQIGHLDEHIERKKEIYERYKEGFRNLPIIMNPYDVEKSSPNFWLSCILIDSSALSKQVRSESETLFTPEREKSCPTEILSRLKYYNVEGRPIWKPMHLQPIYYTNAYVTANGNGRGRSNSYINEDEISDVGTDIFHRGLCLPSDIKMTKVQQKKVIDIVCRCFE